MTASACVASLVRLSTPKGGRGRSPCLVLLVLPAPLPAGFSVHCPGRSSPYESLLSLDRESCSKIDKIIKTKRATKRVPRAGISARPPPTFLRQPPHAPYPSATFPIPTLSSPFWNLPARREVVAPPSRRLARASQTSPSGQTRATLPNSSPRLRTRFRSASASRSTGTIVLDEVEGNKPPSEFTTHPISTIPVLRLILKRIISESLIPRPDVSLESSGP